MKKKNILLLVVVLLYACTPVATANPTTPSTGILSTASVTIEPNLKPTDIPTASPTHAHENERGIYASGISGESIYKVAVGNYYLPKFTADARQIAFVEKIKDFSSSKLLLYNRASQQTTELDDFEGEITDLTISPKGDKFVLLISRINNSAIYEYQVSTRNVVKLYETQEGIVIRSPLSWSYDSKWVAYSQCTKFINDTLFPPCEIFILDTETNESQQVTTLPTDSQGEQNKAPSWSPIDNRLGFVHSEGMANYIHFLDFNKNPPELIKTAITTNFGLAPFWSSDGDWILVDGGMTLSLVNVNIGEKKSLFNGGIGGYIPAKWLSNGKIVMQASGCCCISNIAIYDPQNQSPYLPLDFFQNALNGKSLYQYNPDISFDETEIVFEGLYDSQC